MHKPARWPYRPTSTLMRLFAALALVAQIAVVLAPVAEGFGGVGMAAHVESGGNASHHAHDDSTCIACQVRAFHGATARLGSAAPLAARRSTPPVLTAEAVTAADLVAHRLPRAPPCAI